MTPKSYYYACHFLQIDQNTGKKRKGYQYKEENDVIKTGRTGCSLESRTGCSRKGPGVIKNMHSNKLLTCVYINVWPDYYRKKRNPKPVCNQAFYWPLYSILIWPINRLQDKWVCQ